jgi:hypothetical protein
MDYAYEQKCRLAEHGRTYNDLLDLPLLDLHAHNLLGKAKPLPRRRDLGTNEGV